MARCKKCNKELASDHRGKKCDNCKNKALEYAKTIFYGGFIGVASVALLLSYTKNETTSTHDEERDDEIDESLLD